MAQVSYNSYNNKNKVYKVGFFPTLADGEEILVRFPYSKDETFHTVTTHNLKVNGIFRYVSCPEDNCPLCAKGDKVKETIFVKVLIYKTEGNEITTKSVVWARPRAFGKNIEDALSAAYEYNIVEEGTALEDIVFKIKRVGTGKSTQYSVKPAKAMYQTSELYAKKFDDFNDLKIGRVFYLEKTADEINAFLTNGSFPSTYSKPVKPVEHEAEVKVQAQQEPTIQTTAAEPLPTIMPKSEPQPVVSNPTPVVSNPTPVPAAPISNPSPVQEEDKKPRRYSFR